MKFINKISPVLIVTIIFIALVSIIMSFSGLLGYPLCNFIEELFNKVDNTRKGDWEVFTKALALFVVVGALIKYWDNKNKEEKANLKKINDFVKLEILVEYINNIPIIHTKVVNDVTVKKGIKHSFLLITKKDCKNDFLTQTNKCLNSKFEFTNEFVETKHLKKLFKESFAFIPLEYYFSENIAVGNEILQFSHTLTQFEIDSIKTTLNDNEEFEVRFFVFSSESHPHRSVATTLIPLPNN